ncbi:hypothetical protein [Leptospira sp. GIMC2001]|uniref:hypothetical protein n=1 Tax=Leptospira sp. GIMC2001 TaxID=1513297 RepID=UPI00234B1E13|nr:hypothetical protein [Leptospira sp. GIMC2001]WCL47996.1 hypothetical protein O4O04_11775 [Leptospira sp. GIMC2001]
MRTIHFRLIFIFIPILSSNIWSDVILLKNGKTIEGKYIESDDNWLVIDNFEKLIRIQSNQVQSMDVGFSGIPICYKLKNNSDKNCNGILHFLSRNKMVIAQGSGYMEALEIPISEIDNFQIQINKKNDQLSRYIRSGIILRISLTNKDIIIGKYLKTTDRILQFQVENETKKIPENQIQLVEYESDFHIDENMQYVKYLLPGYSQWQRQSKAKGALLMGMSTISLLGIGYEYNQAMQSSKREITYIPVNNQLVGTNSLSNNSKFDGHIRNMNILSGVLLICYIYNTYDIVYDSNDSYGNRENLSSIQFTSELKQRFPDKNLFAVGQTNDLWALYFSF